MDAHLWLGHGWCRGRQDGVSARRRRDKNLNLISDSFIWQHPLHYLHHSTCYRSPEPWSRIFLRKQKPTSLWATVFRQLQSLTKTKTATVHKKSNHAYTNYTSTAFPQISCSWTVPQLLRASPPVLPKKAPACMPAAGYGERSCMQLVFGDPSQTN